MSWVLVALTAWLLCSVAVAPLIARSIRLADRRADADWFGATMERPAEADEAEDQAFRTAVVRDCLRPAARRSATRRAGRR